MSRYSLLWSFVMTPLADLCLDPVALAVFVIKIHFLVVITAASDFSIVVRGVVLSCRKEG